VVAPSTQALLTQWTWEPSVVIGLLLLTAAYFYVVGPYRRRHELGSPVSPKQVTYFVLSVVVLVVSLLSPIDYIGDRYLFSVHMVQHLLLAAVWPPLLLLSIPGWLVADLLRWKVGAALIRALTYPVIALAAFNLDVYLWHLPGLYDLTLRNEQVHILEHLSFMGFGLLNWWPVLCPLRSLRLSYPLQILYLFLDGMLMMVLGIVFTFSPIVFYAAYASVPQLWGIPPLADQANGGLIMWYPGNIPYALLLIVAFYRWFESGEPTHRKTQTAVSPSSTVGPPVS